MVGANSVEELNNIRDQTEKILRRGGFVLSKFYSNQEDILNSIDPLKREPFMQIDNHDVVKALGLIWEPRQDVFLYSYTAKQDDKITKRTVLSEMASLFDPLGLLCPVITLAKVFYQGLWNKNLKWDDELDASLASSWTHFRSELQNLPQISVPRYMFGPHDAIQLELHGFSDASEKAYGACVYLKAVSRHHSPTIRLFCAKSKVSPTKTVTIARLELMAATLLADLIARLKKEALSEIHIDQEYYWTDSLICLCWLNREPSSWSTFVAHRVAKIQRLTSVQNWKHVSGEHNPADIASRGALPSDLANSKLWFNGPNFLMENTVTFTKNIPTDVDDEKRVIKCAFVSDILPDITEGMRFSTNFRGIRRSIVYVLRFIKNCREKAIPKATRKKYFNRLKQSKAVGIPTIVEEESAEIIMLRILQQNSFGEEYNQLQKNRSVSNSSPMIGLAPFIDNHGLIRVGGRLKCAELSYDYRHPILLPSSHRYSKAIIEYFHHIRTFHAGASTVLTAIRTRYWIINGLIECRRVLHRCVWCFRMRPKVLTQIMGDLPKDRLNFKTQRPFIVSGVDFAGPLTVRHHMRCKVGKKVYVALFICMATKAVHLELVVDLSKEAFIRALKRFIADRGCVTKMFSDNATNFRGTANHLKEVAKILKEEQEDIRDACNSLCVEWCFIPPRAPNFGGLWEASIKLAKRLIKNIIGNTETTLDELQTIVRQVAAVINSRPITPISSDPNDLLPLTPGHFLYGGPPTSLPEPSVDIPINRVKLHQKISWVVQQYWKRFQKEYLINLQIRNKWKNKKANISPGTMVLVRDDLAPPLMWKLGRIVDTTPDANGFVRIVKVRTSQGEIERAISGIAPLPIE